MKKYLAITSIVAVSLISNISHAADVKENWEKHCQKCHGPDGKGDTKMGKKVGVKDYTDAKFQEAMKDDVAIKTIKEGLVEDGKKKMDAYAEKLSDEKMKASVAHIRTFKK